MPVKEPRELFVQMLSDVRNGAERSAKMYQELGQAAQDAEIKEALEARAFVSDKILSTLDQCFTVMGEKPMTSKGKLHEAFVEDFRRELAEIQSPEAKALFILAKAIRLAHIRLGEYIALVAAADLSGHRGVGVLLESCLADKLAFAERTRRIIRNRVEQRVAARRAG
jgi:ferritin-like metal-binding protein YciE